ncbi:glycosyltransferase family 2 protein [Photobacterium angustum]|uniref:Glycosyltransferase 2-like domain-containing protein n=1 Tax=Photobacterium angustum TaxID=661 RepID=A0A2S7VVY0_PHOAN|nr:glycosyltransferase family 2 protein [Photobacterium angustum]PQJ66266.1 hypothetical protein BTO08_01950 [Photobacterium angustum]
MISVVITTKDRKDFLERAINSIFNNEMLPDEIIIVNDGGKAVTSFKHDKIQFKIINNPQSLGGNRARNQGIELSSGDYIFFLDDDDALTPNSISERLKVFDNPDIVLAFTGVKFVNSSNLDTVMREKKPYSEEITNIKLLAKGNLIGSTSCVAVRRDAIFNAGLFDEKLSALQDYDTWIRVSKIGKIGNDNQSNLIYTIHDTSNQISSKYDRYLVAGEYMYKKYITDLNEYNISREFLSNRYLRVAMSASSTSEFIKYKYLIKSLKYKISIYGIALLLPTILLKKFKKFV